MTAGTEIGYRTAISRAYYCCFHYASPLSRELDPPTDTSRFGTHERLIQTFLKSRRNDLIGIGYLLQQCKSMRVDADYVLDEAVNQEYGEESIRKAERLIKKVDGVS